MRIAAQSTLTSPRRATAASIAVLHGSLSHVSSVSRYCSENYSDSALPRFTLWPRILRDGASLRRASRDLVDSVATGAGYPYAAAII